MRAIILGLILSLACWALAAAGLQGFYCIFMPPNG